MRELLAKLLKSATLRTALVAAVTGLSFMVASLVLARALEVEAFADVILVVTLINLGLALGPFGQDHVIVRRKLRHGRAIVFYGHATILVAALLLAAAALFVYGLRPALVVAVGLGVALGGSVYLAAAIMLADRRHMSSMLTSQGHNLVLLAIGLGCLLAGGGDAVAVIGYLIAGFMLLAALAWRQACMVVDGSPDYTPAWREAAWLAVITSVTLGLTVLERLLVPLVLDARALAEFAVLASIVMAPFRLMQIGVSRSLLSELRHAETAEKRRRLLAREFALIVAVSSALAVVLWFATPRIAEFFLAGKYVLSGPLVGAAIVTGFARAMSTVASTSLSALADTTDLSNGARVSVLALGAAVLGGVVGAQFGLVGLVFGVGVGWMLQGATCLWLIRRPLAMGRHRPVPDDPIELGSATP